MTVDSAKCPHCGSRLTGDEIETLEIDSGGIVPMGASKGADEELYVCPSCETILA
jgi:hypothetical protein